jgi:hypothetical protein
MGSAEPERDCARRVSRREFVRSVAPENPEPLGTGGRCCGWSATPPRSDGGFKVLPHPPARQNKRCWNLHALSPAQNPWINVPATAPPRTSQAELMRK